MTQVDEFMAVLANDLAQVQKENATLKAKMKVLADKVAEYRGNEDALRMAVISAQKMASTIETDARTRSDTMLSEAQAQADDTVAGAEEQARGIVADAEARARQLVSDAQAQAESLTGDAKHFLENEGMRLEEAKRESAKFIENMNLLCRRQLSFLEKVSEMDFVQALRAEREAAAAAAAAEAEAEEAEEEEREEAPEETPEAIPGDAAPEEPEPPEFHETVRSIEETVARAADEPVVLPAIEPAPAEDELPTRPFNIVNEPTPEEKPFQFFLDEVDE
jgi:cell division initiation protein